MELLRLIGIYCFIWCITPSYGGCPSFYDVPCSVPNNNPGHDARVFETSENRRESMKDWETLDDTMQQTCKTTGLKLPKIVMIWLKNQVHPGYCSVTKICNQTACLELGTPSNLFTEEIYLPEKSIDVVLRNNETYVLNLTEIKIHSRLGSIHPYRHCKNQTAQPHKLWDDTFNNFSSKLNKWHNTAESFYYDYCKDVTVHDFLFHFDGQLNFFCSRLAVCSYQRCLLFSTTALKYAQIFPIKSCYTNSYPELPICSAIQTNTWPFGRRRRRPSISKTGLFQLPFTKYCGPGTDVIAADDNGGPTGKVDEACRTHDIAYMLGGDPVKADEELLLSVWDSSYYYAFWLAIRTKQAFESVTGKAYTSSLYITPTGTAATFAHYFYFKSVFDGFESNSTLMKTIKEKEESRKNVVLDIWRGQCYVQKRPGSDTDGGAGPPVDITPSGSASTPTDTRDTRHVENTDDETFITVASDYPPPPHSLAPCRIVINEILTDDGLTATSFIELLKVCPDGTRERKASLKNFYLAVLKAADPVELHVFIDLGSQRMQHVTETLETPKGLRPKDVYYFVAGSTNVKEKNMNLINTHGGKDGIPSGSNSDDTYSVVLLESASIKQFHSKVQSRRTVLPLQLTDEEQDIFGNALQDIVTYGEPCSLVKCSMFMKWNLGLIQLHEEKIISSIPDQTDSNVLKSINRCAQNSNPMQQESWESSTPSPLQRNECTVRVDALYTFKHGSSIQSSAQYVIMNVKNFFHSYKLATASELLQGSDLELTSKATGISTRTINRIEARHKSGTIQTPKGRKRKRISRAIFRFTEADKEHIKEFIQRKFKSNLPPFFEDMYEDTRQYLGDQNPPRAMCAKNTFRKLLYMMGFHYGRMDALLVVLERPDIVVKRGVYLKKMKENDQEKTPKPVIYTDESWIDPHSRSGKAWVPKASQCSHEDKLKFNYAKHHTNRGKRIILIHAAGPDGLIHNSMEVFEVGGSRKSKSSEQIIPEDYHDNIESTFYYSWFRDLCINVKQLYGEAIIVIDNAPYHTKSDAPTSRSLKKEFLDYLLKVDVDGKLTDFDKNKKYLRWQLWEMVLKYKKGNSDHYIIDRLAREYGQTVIRLPPHQCNFNPIEMLWAQGKDHVRRNNPDQTIESVKNTIKSFFLMYPPDRWRNLVEHTDRLREEYWKTDKLYDEFLDAHEHKINEDPSTVNEVAGDSTGDVEYGPLDSYMHAGTEIAFDENSDIILPADGAYPDT